MKGSQFLTSLFLKYQSDLKRFVANKFGDVHDAEDIVQDTFHNFLRVESPEAIENPRAYLYQSAQNLALNRIRTRNRHDAYISASDETDVSVPLEREIDAQKDLESISDAMHLLPDVSRRIFLMNRVSGKTYGEISQETNLSVSSVEKHMSKALRFLREHLDE
ncbi:MAG: hypothetical protein COA42_03515 [Alteromonadaceae bacterium]|nr:MAG: hypothetical protein COA42_03515 [Alteromonadaceae bacterium]